MRLIPKKTKLNTTIWKSFTLVDVVIIFCLFMIAVTIGLSNLPYKWIIVLVYASLCIVAFMPTEDGRAYSEIGYLIKYLCSHKLFTDYSANAAKRVDALIPHCKLRANGVLDYGDYLGAIIEVDSCEFALLSLSQQNEYITSFAQALNILATGEVAQILKIDRPIKFNNIANLTYDKLEAAKKGTDRVKELILKSRLAQIDCLNNVVQQYRPYYYIVLYSTDINSLNNLVYAFNDRLAVGQLHTRRLAAREVALVLKYSYTRDFDEDEINEIPIEKYMDYVKPHKVKITSRGVVSDGKRSFTYAVRDYPLAVGNAWGADLFNIDNTKAVMTIVPIEREKAIKQIDRTVTEIGSRSESGKVSELISIETHLETLGNLAQEMQNESQGLFDCTLTITAFNNSGKSDNALRKEIRQRIIGGNFHVNTLRYRQLEGMITSAVTRRNALKRLSRGINSESLAAIFPFVFTSIIEERGITLGESNGYPLIVDPWKWQYSSGEHYNSNMFVAGMPGTGKSYFAKSLVAELYSENTVIYILDPENEYRTLCHNVGGNFLDVGTAATGRINPFHIYQTLAEDGGQAAPEINFDAHLLYLDNFFSTTLIGINQDTLEELNNLVTKCYKLKGITRTTDTSKLSADAFPTFSDLYALVLKELKDTKSGVRMGNLQRAEMYLKKFCADGRYSTLWNGKSTLEVTDRLTVFNFQSLFEAKNKVTSNGQMLTVLRFLEQQIINLRELNASRSENDKIHPVILLDEGYMFIDAKNPAALDFIYQWYKRIRKYYGTMIFLTQNLADIVGNQELISKTSAIINNTQYVWIFTLQGGDVDVLQEIFNARNLTSAEIEEIQHTNKPKGTAFFMGSSTQRAMAHIITNEVIVELFSKKSDLSELEHRLLTDTTATVDIPRTTLSLFDNEDDGAEEHPTVIDTTEEYGAESALESQALLH